MNTRVPCEHVAALVDDDARACRTRLTTGDERGVVVVGYKTNLVTIGFVRDRQPARARVFANEVRDDLLVELTLEVENIVRDVDGGGDAPRVVQIVERTTASK